MKKILFFFSILNTCIITFAQVGDHNWDTIMFETNYQYIQIDEAEQNIWEIGTPDKVFFDSSFSVPNAIVTDISNTYPVNNNSYFDLFIGEYNNPWYENNVFIEIKHKYDTDTLEDGCFISVSYDNGLSFVNIINDLTGNFFYSPSETGLCTENLYSNLNTLFNEEFGFSGNSQGWVTTKFGWYNPVVDKSFLLEDTMIVRFNFISDNVESSKEGWMIDNIRLFSIDQGDGVEDNVTSNFRLYPNPALNELMVELEENYDNVSVEIMNIQGQTIKQQEFLDSKDIKINVGDLDTGFYFLVIKSRNRMNGYKKIMISK